MLVDCANGAATAEAPGLFRACGVKAEFMHCCRTEKISTSSAARSIPRPWRARDREQGPVRFGITFDGDADRALFSDAEGKVVNGDAVLLIAGRDMQGVAL